jgi:hypothetical protein
MIGFLLFVAQLTAGDISYAQAKSFADEYEAAISPKDKAELVQTQGKALDDAIATCGPIKGTPPAFTIVAHVTPAGATDRTWRSGESALAKCFEQKLNSTMLPIAAGKAFYTSYEISF